MRGGLAMPPCADRDIASSSMEPSPDGKGWGNCFAQPSEVFPRVRIQRRVENTTELARVEMHPLGGAQARERGEGCVAFCEVQGTLQLQESGGMHWGIRAWPRDAQYPIERGGRLQIILQPLTLWRPTKKVFLVALGR